MTTEEEIKDVSQKIEDCKLLLKDPRVQRLPSIFNDIKNELYDYEEKLDVLNCNSEYSDLVGKYYRYSNPPCKDEEYLYIKRIHSTSFIADIVIASTYGYDKQTYIYENAERDCLSYVITKFKEITKDEFIGACNRLFKQSLSILNEKP